MKLEFLLVLYAVKNKIEIRSKQRWYCQHIPARVVEGYTLAEVLITLLIIGVVASLVIPALLQDTQDAEYRAAFKKGMATFSQAFMRMRIDNGGTLANAFIMGDHAGINRTLSQYLNITQYSTTRTNAPNLTWHDYLTYYRLNGQVEVSGNVVCHMCPSAQLSDGSFFMIFYNGTTSDLNNCNLNGAYPRAGLCFNIVYDINGKKAPNKFGKDLYILAVYKDKVIPADWALQVGSIDESSCTSNGTGYGCAIKYAKE